MLCVSCAGPRPLQDWSVSETCEQCGAGQSLEQQEVVERYRDLNNILQQINNNAEELGEANYNYQSAWVAAAMGEICSERDIRQDNIKLEFRTL